MNHTDFLQKLDIRVDTVQGQALLARSVTEHMRNGRGFWPVVSVDGVTSVVRFSAAPLASAAVAGQLDPRWTPETGSIEVVPLHALPVTDWPKVRMVG